MLNPENCRLWSEREAERVLAHASGRRLTQPWVCASGISPSGPIHLGNLREVFTTHLVVQALRAQGLPAVHWHSWDDYDRLRKLPAGIDPGFAQHIGRPLALVPDPHGECESYADYYIQQFSASLTRLGVQMQEVRQSQQYRSGYYNQSIRLAMRERAQIFSILEAQRTAGRLGEPAGERMRAYYPFQVYCQGCGRDETQITAYEEPSLQYRCRCGHSGEMSLAEGQPISGKLSWKVDWPMRWAYEQVDYEPAGEDHHAPSGSFTVGRELVKLFDWHAPASTVYSFVSLTGAKGKMSGSAGTAATPEHALRYLEPSVIRWLYIRRLPSQSFPIDLSAPGVLRLTEEWDRFCALADSPEGTPVQRAELKACLSGSTGPLPLTRRPLGFRLMAAAADLSQGERETSRALLEQHLPEGERVSLEELEPRLSLVLNYLELLPREQRTLVCGEFNQSAWDTLEELTREQVRLLRTELTSDWSLDGLTALVYAVPKLSLGLPRDHPPTPELKLAQREFFKALYTLLCQSENGPRLPTLLLSIGPERALRLLGS